MSKYRPVNHIRAFGIALAAALIGVTSPALAAGGSPTKHEAGPWSSARAAQKAPNATYRSGDPKETAEFARVEIAPTEKVVRGNPLMKGSSPFYPGNR